jgi:hypothetical protein
MEKFIKKRILDYRRRNRIQEIPLKVVGQLSIRVRYPGENEWTDLGVVSKAVVTQGAIAQIVAVLQGGSATTLQNFKYHASGTGTAAEAGTDISLGSEVETREVGTQTSTGPGNYRSVAAHTYNGTFAITEHGLFSAATGGVLFDRSKFAPILVSPGTQIQFTYDLQIIGS